MKIFIDSDYKCYTENDGIRREIETDFFNGKCKAFVEGYRLIPRGETWHDGDIEFSGELIVPWKNYDALAELQAQYEEMLAKQQDMTQALEILEVNKE